MFRFSNFSADFSIIKSNTNINLRSRLSKQPCRSRIVKLCAEMMKLIDKEITRIFIITKSFK